MSTSDIAAQRVERLLAHLHAGQGIVACRRVVSYFLDPLSMLAAQEVAGKNAETEKMVSKFEAVYTQLATDIVSELSTQYGMPADSIQYIKRVRVIGLADALLTFRS